MKTLSFAFGACSLVLLSAACGGDDTAASTAGSGAAGAASSSASSGSSSGSSSSSGTGGGGGGTPGACGDIVTFEDGLSPLAEIHVATLGSDVIGDGTHANPFATIEHAATLAVPGTAIHVHAGTYPADAYIDNLSGDAGAPIWIGGAPGEARPVIEGGSEAIHFSRARYLILHDLEIRGALGNGINCDDGGELDNAQASHHVIFRNLFIHDIGSGGNEDCLKLSGINDYFVLDSEMTVCGGAGSGSAVDHVGCHRGLLARNNIHDLTGTGIQCKGGSEDIEIRWNRFTEAGVRQVNMGGSTGFQFFRPPLTMGAPNAEARNIRVVANVIQGGDCAVAFVGCVDCLLANNTIVDPHNWMFRILQETVSSGGYEFLPASNGTIINNIFYVNRSDLSGEDINVGAGTDPQSFTAQTNLWYAHDDPTASAPATLPVTETGGVIGEDPAFSDATGGDYHIAPTSPAAGRGTAVPGVVGDMVGACYGMPPSIGAYEATVP